MPNPREYDDDDWTENEEIVGDDDADSDADLLVCPSCSRPVHEDTQQCPYCGDWITPAYPAAAWKKPAWIAAVVLVILAMVLFVVL